MGNIQKKNPGAVTARTGQAPAPVKLHTGISAWRFGNLRCWLAAQASNIDQGNTK